MQSSLRTFFGSSRSQSLEQLISELNWIFNNAIRSPQKNLFNPKYFIFFFQLLGQTAATAPTASVSAQSPLSETNPPSLSPNGVTQTGALSPGALSQTSQNAGTTSLNNGAIANNATPATACCENGRPVLTDPVSGQTVCSCQYDSARLALSGYRSAGVYGSPYPSTDQNPYPSIGVDSSAFYSPLVSKFCIFYHFYTLSFSRLQIPS